MLNLGEGKPSPPSADSGTKQSLKTISIIKLLNHIGPASLTFQNRAARSTTGTSIVLPAWEVSGAVHRGSRIPSRAGKEQKNLLNQIHFAITSLHRLGKPLRWDRTSSTMMRTSKATFHSTLCPRNLWSNPATQQDGTGVV
jgi:hypothetical protein